MYIKTTPAGVPTLGCLRPEAGARRPQVRLSRSTAHFG